MSIICTYSTPTEGGLSMIQLGIQVHALPDAATHSQAVERVGRNPMPRLEGAAWGVPGVSLPLYLFRELPPVKSVFTPKAQDAIELRMSGEVHPFKRLLSRSGFMSLKSLLGVFTSCATQSPVTKSTGVY
jgi:hypothetical protein